MAAPLMSLTAGSGPFGARPAAQLSFERPEGSVLVWDPVPYRVRAVVDDVAVVDSRNVKLLHETGHLPVYYFPEEDARHDLLEPSAKTSRCPWKGEATYRSIVVGERRIPDAVWTYLDPLPSASFIAGHLAVYWNLVDRWLVEDTAVFGHARDPYHRVDVYPTTRHVRIRVGDAVVAESTRAQMLVETGHPPRYYLPLDDVRAELLEPSEHTTRCAYKGLASYWHVNGEENLAWTYREPLRDGEPVRDLVAFFQERADLELDGELQERPATQWSH